MKDVEEVIFSKFFFKQDKWKCRVKGNFDFT